MNTCTHALKPLSSIMLGVWFATAAAAMAQSPATVLTFTPGGKQKPAVQSTRVDLAAGSTFSTGPAEVRELLLSDGTSIVLKPNSEMVIESINSAGPTPDKIVLRVSKGLVRIAGGANNERSPIVVNTSS